MSLIDDAKGWLDKEGLSLDQLEAKAGENTEEAKKKIMDFAQAHNISVNPADDAKTMWEKIKSKL